MWNKSKIDHHSEQLTNKMLMEKAFEESIQLKEGTLLQHKRLEVINEEMIAKMNEQEDERF